MGTAGKEESNMYEQINPKEHEVNHVDYKDVKEISKRDQIMDSEV